MVDPAYLAIRQFKSWSGMRLDHAEIRAGLYARLNSENCAYINTFIYELDGTEVIFCPAEHILHLQAAGHHLEVVRRATLFARLLRETLASNPLKFPLTLAIDMGDLAQPAGHLPVFSFQKDTGSQVIALPDHELIEHNYLEDIEADNLLFIAKKDAAFFSGSATGVANYNLEDLEASRIPRIRAARFFKDCKSVDFFLPNVCQYASEEARQMLLSEGFGDGVPIKLSEAYNYKFSILMEGNGATCSRTAILLHSQCAVLKYVSSYELYYTSALIPGEHFIPIYEDGNILDIIAEEKKSPGSFEAVAYGGKRFAETILSRSGIIQYTRDLLDQYSKLFYY